MSDPLPLPPSRNREIRRNPMAPPRTMPAIPPGGRPSLAVSGESFSSCMSVGDIEGLGVPVAWVVEVLGEELGSAVSMADGF